MNVRQSCFILSYLQNGSMYPKQVHTAIIYSKIQGTIISSKLITFICLFISYLLKKLSYENL